MNGSAADALDILANAVQRLEEQDKIKPLIDPSEHRVSCHRCGNIRKKKLCCPRPDCPHIFCGRCADKLRTEHGESIFDNGCPVCKELCCCSDKTIYCDRRNHCYRKCPSTKTKLYINPHANLQQPPSQSQFISANNPFPSGGKGSGCLTTTTDTWNQDSKCRAPALDFLASIVTNSGGPDTASISSASLVSAIGVGIGKVIGSTGSEEVLTKSDSVRSLVSSSSEYEINSNRKRTPVDGTTTTAPQSKQLKVGEGDMLSQILPLAPAAGNL